MSCKFDSIRLSAQMFDLQGEEINLLQQVQGPFQSQQRVSSPQVPSLLFQRDLLEELPKGSCRSAFSSKYPARIKLNEE